MQLIPLILSDEAIISQISWFYPRCLLFPKTGLMGVLSSWGEQEWLWDRVKEVNKVTILAGQISNLPLWLGIPISYHTRPQQSRKFTISCPQRRPCRGLTADEHRGQTGSALPIPHACCFSSGNFSAPFSLRPQHTSSHPSPLPPCPSSTCQNGSWHWLAFPWR